MICPECGGIVKEYEESGELCCTRCGLVIGDKIPTTSPTPHELFGDDGRFGPKLTKLLEDGGLGTVVRRGSQYHMTWASRLQSKRESSVLRRLLSEVLWVSSKLGVSRDVSERAASLCRMAVSRGVPRCGARALAASAVYLSLKEMGFARTMNEVAAASDTPLGPISRNVGFFVFSLGVRTRQLEPEAVILRIAQTLGLGSTVCMEAGRIYLKLREAGITAGRRPQAVASAALYMACRRLGMRIPASHVAEAAGVGYVTLRKLVKAALGVDGIQR
ncbi:MAG: transcription initiation factor IIB family protein [Nitrososphaerota archaeon]